MAKAFRLKGLPGITYLQLKRLKRKGLSLESASDKALLDVPEVPGCQPTAHVQLSILVRRRPSVGVRAREVVCRDVVVGQ